MDDLERQRALEAADTDQKAFEAATTRAAEANNPITRRVLGAVATHKRKVAHDSAQNFGIAEGLAALEAATGTPAVHDFTE